MFVVFFVFCREQQMVHMGGESWRAIKDLKAPFPDLKAWACGSSADMCIFFYVVFAFIVLLFIVYFSTYICFPIFLSY